MISIAVAPYLEGTKFIVQTDHHSLEGIISLVHANGKPVQWRLHLSEFDFKVGHGTGIVYEGADTLPRGSHRNG